MRVPLHLQVFLPFAGLLAVTITAVSLAGVWQAVRTADEGMRQHVRDAADVLVAADFPLTDAVLRQTHGLSGAEFVGVDEAGMIRASSLPPTADYGPLRNLAALGGDEASGESRLVTLDGVEYGHQIVSRTGRLRRDDIAFLHILYPQDLRRRLLRRAIGSPVALGGSALIVAALLSWWIAARVCRPIERVRAQFDNIAAGRSLTVPLPARNDELRDLVCAANLLARQLQDRDDAVRRSARASLLGQLSGGLCHHLRNAAAGAKLALQLYRRRAPDGAAELDVALRQLALSEEYLQRLLTLGKPQAPQFRAADLRAVVEETASLTAPAFRHRLVKLTVDVPPDALPVEAVDADLLRSAVANLLANALDAAQENGWVELKLRVVDETAQITVVDGGAGPPPHVVARLFEPFVTAKPDGVGLGLAASQRIAELHGGTLVFRNRPHTTFELTLPLRRGAVPLARPSTTSLVAPPPTVSVSNSSGASA